jgi:hypothetical protein
VEQANHDRLLRLARGALGDAAFEQASAAGRMMTRDEVIASALGAV